LKGKKMNTNNNTTTSKRNSILPWIPFAFCAFLSVIAVSLNVVVLFISQAKYGMDSGFVVFACFLPMTFFFVAVAVSQIRKELKSMSDRIDQLEREKK
jgi:ACR3 family arsenite efflux pump ArsB